MAAKIDRQVARFNDLLLTNSLSTTAEIDMQNYACLALFFPVGWTSATVTVYSLNPATGTYLALYNSSSQAITFTATASTCQLLDDSVFPTDKIKLVTNQAGNNALVVGGIAKS